VTAAAVQLYEESLQDASGNLPGPATDVFWQFSAPAGLRSLLAWVTKRYQRPELWVTESGMAVAGEANMTQEAALNDEPRLEFFRYTVCLTEAAAAQADKTCGVGANLIMLVGVCVLRPQSSTGLHGCDGVAQIAVDAVGCAALAC
jgi:beta-glucosidase